MFATKKLLDVTLPIELWNKNNGQGNHWIHTAKLRNSYERDLRVLKQVRTPFEVPVNVIATRILGQRQRFWDSSSVLRGSYKQFEDSLVACGWFHDDSYRWINETIGRQDGSQRTIGPSIRMEVFQA